MHEHLQPMRVNGMSDDFLPFPYAKAVRATPDAYVPVRSLWEDALVLHEFRHAVTLADLERHFKAAARRLRDAGDKETLALITAAKDRRKKEMTA